ncbi:MAG: hypothetical protein KAI73_05750 [Rhodospirillaceae bacterium]|nr:hypothetical protein [Rhodospirillaceae bacterium]
MNQDLKDATRKSLREYVRKTIDDAVAAKGMAPEILAVRSGMNLGRTIDILFNNFPPTLDETFMMFTALGLSLDDLVEYAKRLPFAPPPAEYFCGKCRVNFPVKPRRSINSTFTRCSVPGCKQRFWHGWAAGDFVTVGIDPKDLVQLEVAK